VLVIKLADRLHNMRTLSYQPPHKQERTARATLEVLVPLADRLGIQLFKRELEDLALATLHPAEYQEIERLLVDRAPQREAYLAGIVERLAADLRAAKIKASVAPRLRHAYSIHQKMLERRGGLTGVYDVARILVVVAGEAPDCYMALGTVHGQYHPVSGRFQDFIALPKFNLYQSLHTTVVGPGGKPIEVQLRTEAMHRIAEYGIAAYYREVGRRSADVPAAASSPDELVWLRRLLDWQRSVSDPGEFFASLREDLTDHEILLFTPKGDAVPLARGGTPVDFAYTVRSDLGHRCIGARVNGRLVPLASTLTDGDTVEVLTAPTEHPGPSEQWLGFVKTPKAQIQIRQWLAAQRSDTAAEDAVEAGRREIGRLLREQGDLGLDDETLALLDREDLEVLYTAVGQGQLPAASVAQWLLTVAGRTEVQPG
jgi:GTP pyrophosphokinase